MDWFPGVTNGAPVTGSRTSMVASNSAPPLNADTVPDRASPGWSVTVPRVVVAVTFTDTASPTRVVPAGALIRIS